MIKPVNTPFHLFYSMNRGEQEKLMNFSLRAGNFYLACWSFGVLAATPLFDKRSVASRLYALPEQM